MEGACAVPRVRAFRGTGKKIDFKSWDAAPGLITSVTMSTTTISGSLAFSIPATVLRWRGYWSAAFDETAQANDRMILTLGLAILSTDAVTLGVTAVPDPASEPEYPWIWWGEMALNSFGVIADTTAGWGPSAQRQEIDSKAMRKIKPGESLLAIIQSTNASGAPVTLLDIGQVRVLVGT